MDRSRPRYKRKAPLPNLQRRVRARRNEPDDIPCNESQGEEGSEDEDSDGQYEQNLERNLEQQDDEDVCDTPFLQLTTSPLLTLLVARLRIRRRRRRNRRPIRSRLPNLLRRPSQSPSLPPQHPSAQRPRPPRLRRRIGKQRPARFPRALEIPPQPRT